MPKTVALVCARNEAKTLPAVLKSLHKAKQAGLIQHILVVDDGSTDRTAEVARRFGASVLRLRKNKGKAFAFAAGVKLLARKKPDYLVMLDADLKEFEPREIEKLLAPLRKPEIKMVVAETISTLFDYSGERAFKFSALQPLVKNNPTWMNLLGIEIHRKARQKIRMAKRVGYGLELALNYLLTGRIIDVNVPKHVRVINTNLEKSRELTLGAKGTKEITSLIRRDKPDSRLKSLPKRKRIHKPRRR